jgi:3-oxoacyl-[acyl-carrier protein] reductase
MGQPEPGRAALDGALKEPEMDLGLKGKAAIVTGATRGIGRAIADLLAEEGADVAICARNADQVRSAVAALQAKGGRAFGKAIDIADAAQLKGFIAEAGDALGGIDILVSNASAKAYSPSEDDWRRMFEVDLMGAVRSFDAARQRLEAAADAQGDAAFIIVSSISASESLGASSYGPIKAALIHYAKGLARQTAARKLRVNVISPGSILFEDGYWGEVQREQPEFFAEMIRRNPTGRMGTPEEIAVATVFLASPRSSFTTGMNMVVDGSITTRVAL